jgi:hypothetical protein
MIIVDTTVYRSFVFIVEDGDKEYEVRMAENDISDDWEITDTDGEVITTSSALGQELIQMCSEQKLFNN